MQYFEKEKIFYQEELKEPEKIKRIEEPKIEIKIDPEFIRRLETVAKVIGGDYGMKVSIGKPGEGSYFNPREATIQFDPLYIKEDPEKAIFVAGHEGSHRAVSRSPQELGMKEEKIKELYSKLGFGYFQNVIEDAAVNDWLKEKFPGMKPYKEKFYDKAFEEENAPIVTPEVQRVIQQLGYIPKFVQYGSETLRNWHKGEFSKELDPDVKIALDKTIDKAEDSWETIPSTKYRNEKEIKEKAKERFLINTRDIWSEVEKLTKEDKKSEERRQTLQEAFNQLPEDVKESLKEKIDKAQEELKEFYQKEIREKEIEIERTEKEIENLKKKQEEFSGQEREDLEREIQEEELKKEKLEKEKEDLEKKQKENHEKFGAPIPIDELSDKEKREIDKIFEELPDEKKKEIEDKAEQVLEDFEDQINKDFEGKLNEEKAPSHQETNDEEKREKEMKDEMEKEKKEIERAKRELEEMREKGMTKYDETYKELKPLIDDLYNKLRRIFRKEQLSWKKGYSTGAKLDIEKAMQYEADKTKYKELWMRKTLPEKKDYAFSFLVDLSGSMNGEKIEETFKGTVVLSEVLAKLGIPFEVKGFSTSFSENIKEYKNFDKKISQEIREKLEKIPQEVGGTTPTAEATDKTEKNLIKQKNKNRYLITLTDGSPDDESALRKKIEDIKKKGKIKQIGIGLGSDAKYVEDFYPASVYLEKVNPSEEEKEQGKKDFSEAISALLEDMIKYPQRY